MSRTDEGYRGDAAQYFVAGELCRRGHVAAVTLGSCPNTDILVSNADGNRFAHVQVKTFEPARRSCSVGRKAERDHGASFFWILAGIPDVRSGAAFECFIISSAEMAKNVAECFARRVDSPGVRGQQHDRLLAEEFERLGAEEMVELMESVEIAEQMRAELYKVQIQEKELSSRYTALHPQVIAMRRQLEETRRIYAEEQARSSHSTKRLSPVHQSIQTELASALGLAAGQKAESDSLKQQFEGVQTKIRALNDNELRITELSRRVELLEASYRNYATYREQARIDEALESERISNVNMVQPPSFVAKPSSPRIRLTLLLAFCLATFASLLVPFAAEYLDRSLKTPQQAEQELGLPVLFSVPRTMRNELLVK